MKKLTVDVSDLFLLAGIGVMEWALYNLGVWWAVILAGVILFLIGLNLSRRTGGRR